MALKILNQKIGTGQSMAGKIEINTWCGLTIPSNRYPLDDHLTLHS